MNMNAELSEERILQIIEKIGEKQYRFTERGESRNYNNEFRKLQTLMLELKSRPGDKRVLLKRHYGHPNIKVWLNAATHTLVVAPEEARAQLQAIAETKFYPYAGEAEMRLHHLDTGFYKPT
jgi:hypothetical protein